MQIEWLNTRLKLKSERLKLIFLIHFLCPLFRLIHRDGLLDKLFLTFMHRNFSHPPSIKASSASSWRSIFRPHTALETCLLFCLKKNQVDSYSQIFVPPDCLTAWTFCSTLHFAGFFQTIIMLIFFHNCCRLWKHSGSKWLVCTVSRLSKGPTKSVFPISLFPTMVASACSK